MYTHIYIVSILALSLTEAYTCSDTSVFISIRKQ